MAADVDRNHFFRCDGKFLFRRVGLARIKSLRYGRFMHESCDVAVVGGAFSGAATALLLKRSMPQLRIVIVERTEEFDRKVGESTTEVSSCFLTRVLGLTNYLGHHQLPKQGLRMWFNRKADDAFDACTEIGARYNSRMAGFQVDRATLDEHILATAVAEGCELWRPARVTGIELGGANRNVLTVKMGETVRELTAKWVVDASGRAAVLARKLGHFSALTEHPTNTLWARYTGVGDWDGHELRKKFPKWAEATRTARGWATNHLVGLGWWVWIIPLKGGDVSIGLVYDARLYRPPEGGSIGERVLAHCREHPVGRELFANARAIEGDQRAFSQLPYSVHEVAGDGWACVGDASGFLDPLYSPGLDFCSFTAASVADLIGKQLGTMPPSSEETKRELEDYNRRFRFCFRSWFECIYRDKYFYLGDSELMAAAFLMDIATYHLGPVTQVYQDPATMFGHFPFDGRPGRIAARFIAFYNRRLVRLARKKIEAGKYGEKNVGWRLLIGGFTPEPKVAGRLLFDGIWRWVKMEFAALWWPKKTGQVAADAKLPVAPMAPVRKETEAS
jgi:flavin-dependent dehydrogenase